MEKNIGMVKRTFQIIAYRVFCALASVIAFLCICGLLGFFDGDAREWAETWGAKASVEVRVVDEDGGAVSNAEVEVYFGLSFRPGATVKGKSDGRGMFAAKGKTTGEVYINIRKKGCYETAKKIDIAADENRKVSWGKWKPGKIHCTAKLRPIRNPVKLRTSESEKIHYINEPKVWMGFDILKNDWVKPYGNGEMVDFEIIYESDGKKFLDYTGSRLAMKFVRPYDGAYVRTMDLESEFHTDFEAMTNGLYQTQFKFFERKNAPQDWSSEQISENQFLVLRVRSKVDGDGNFIGAHYAMIQGPLSFGYGRKSFGFIGSCGTIGTCVGDGRLGRGPSQGIGAGRRADRRTSCEAGLCGGVASAQGD